MKVRGVLCGFVLVIGAFSAGAQDKITMSATPQISFEPAHLIVRTRIEPDASNRAIEIVIDSADFYRSSRIELEGDQAPRASVFEFNGVPGGVYEVSARLLGQSGDSRALVRKQVDVIRARSER
jgi:hypothetical protein